jgi:hypothetical protein
MGPKVSTCPIQCHKLGKTYIKYKYTSFFWSRSPVAMFFNTSGNRADTSLPKVMDMMVF